MDFTTVVAAPAIAAMHEQSVQGKWEDRRARRARQHSLHPMQDNIVKNLFSIKSTIGCQRKLETSHPNPLQHKLMRKLFAGSTTEERGSGIPTKVITDPRPLRQQAEPRVKISLRRRITDSATYTWQCEMSEEGPFVFEEVL